MKRASLALIVPLLPSVYSASEQGSADFHQAAIVEAKKLVDRDWVLQTKLRLSPWEVERVDELAYCERWSKVLSQLEAGSFQLASTTSSHSAELKVSLRTVHKETCAAMNAVTIEFRQSLACEEPERAVDWSETAVEFALGLLESVSREEKYHALAYLFIALPEAWRDEDLSRLDSQAATQFDQLVAQLEDRLPREFELLREPGRFDTTRETQAYLEAANDSLRALRVQLRFLRMANALHQGGEVPLCPDEPGGQILLEAAEAGQFLLRSSYQGLARRSPYSRLVTLR